MNRPLDREEAERIGDETRSLRPLDAGWTDVERPLPSDWKGPASILLAVFGAIAMLGVLVFPVIKMLAP